MKVSLTTSMTALFLAGMAVAQTATGPAQLDRMLRDLVAGRYSLDGIRLEAQCLDGGRFVQATAHGAGIAIWNGERQGTLTQDELLTLLRAFVKEGFARMPAAFGQRTTRGRAWLSI